MERLFGILVVCGLLGYGYYEYRLAERAGIFTRPEMPEGAFSVSYPCGFRGIVVGLGERRPDRQYIAYPARDVPEWYLEAWSTCMAPDPDERNEFYRGLEAADFTTGPGFRLEAVCKLDVDGEAILRGWLASVPRV
jgi:hypothetical protein